MTIGDRILQRRRELGITQTELSRRLQISEKSVSSWERNTRTPKLKNVERIAEALETSASYLSSGKEDHMENNDIRFYEGRLEAVVQALSATKRMNETLNGRANISRMIQEQIDILNDICGCLREDATGSPGA